MPRTDTKRKRPGFIDWVKANQKVLIVVMLCLLAFTFAMSPAMFDVVGGQRAQSVGYGESMTATELNRAGAAISQSMLLATGAEVLPSDGVSRPITALFTGGQFNVREFFLFRNKARQEGLTVSDAELVAARHKIWRTLEATTKAAEALAASGKTMTGDPNLDREFNQLLTKRRDERLAKLEEHKVFDPKGWAREIQGRMDSRNIKMRPMEFEKSLRDVLLVAKLEQVVKSEVQVSQEEIFEEFRKKEHRRRPSWVELEAPEGLAAKIEAGLTDEDIQAHYDAQVNDPVRGSNAYNRDARVRFRYLEVPLEHFITEAEAEVTEADIQAEYDRDIGSYIRPDIRADATAFVLETPEEAEKRKQATYKSLEEVSDEVRQAAIERKARTKLRTFGSTLTGRLFKKGAPKPDDLVLGGNQASFDEIAKEYDWIESGQTEFVTQAEAEEKLGKFYDALRFTMRSWFTGIGEDPNYVLDQKELAKLERVFSLYEKDENGRRGEQNGALFVHDVELLPSGVQDLSEAREEVVEDLVHQKKTEILSKALEADLEQIQAGSLDFDSLAGRKVEVEAGGEKFEASYGSVESTPLYLRKFDRVLVAKVDEEETAEGEEKEDEAKADEDEDDAAELPEEVPHESSRALVEGLFRIGEKGEVGTALDEAEGRAYLVRYEGRQNPDAGSFDDRVTFLRRELERDKLTVHLDQWRLKVREEAGVLDVVDETAEG